MTMRMKPMNKGTLFVVTGPSGAGKGTVLGKVFQQVDKLHFSVSATTRAPREGEVNGITHEALLAILIDRLECFQHGPFANEYNAEALDCLHTALAALQTRTAIRTARGVEGTHQI